MAKTKLEEYERVYARNRQEWRKWLEKNYASSPGIWLVYHKKNAEGPCVSYDEAVEEALSFGWIDSKVNKLDKERYIQVFTPRKPRSIWSRSNKERVRTLIKEGLMTPAGLEKVEIAKKDGSWNFIDDIENLIIPEDLKEALKANARAKDNFESFSNSVKKQILYWIKSAKRPETRIRRIEKTVSLAELNKNPWMN